MSIVRFGEEIENLRRFQTLVLRAEELVELGRGCFLSFRCLGRLKVRFHFIKEATQRWREESFKFRRRTDVRGRRFLFCYKLEIYALLESKQGVYKVQGAKFIDALRGDEC